MDLISTYSEHHPGPWERKRVLSVWIRSLFSDEGQSEAKLIEQEDSIKNRILKLSEKSALSLDRHRRRHDPQLPASGAHAASSLSRSTAVLVQCSRQGACDRPGVQR